MKIITSFIILLSFCMILCSCTSERNQAKAIEGVWQSIGHGKILKIDSTRYQVFDMESPSCSPIKFGSIKEMDSISDLKEGILTIQHGSETYNYEKIDKFPMSCTHNKSNPHRKTPEENLKPLLIASSKLIFKCKSSASVWNTPC